MVIGQETCNSFFSFAVSEMQSLRLQFWKTIWEVLQAIASSLWLPCGWREKMLQLTEFPKQQILIFYCWLIPWRERSSGHANDLKIDVIIIIGLIMMRPISYSIHSCNLNNMW